MCYQVGPIHLEDRFCAGRKGKKWMVGWLHSPGDSTWRVLWLAVEKPCFALVGFLYSFLLHVELILLRAPFLIL